MESLLQPPIGFAHRGARTLAPDNTIAAFRLALDRGASGLESDVWLTADGIPVLDHDGHVRSGLRRIPIGRATRDSLPPHVPTLAELYERCGTGFQLSLDVKDPEAVPAVLAVAHQAGSGGAGPVETGGSGQERSGGAVGRLWLCHHDLRHMAAWRQLSPDVRLVDSTRLRRLREGPERRAADLAEAGIDAINMHATDWTPGLTTLFHRFQRLAFGWDAQFERIVVALLRIGIDAVYSDDVDILVSALREAQL